MDERLIESLAAAVGLDEQAGQVQPQRQVVGGGPHGGGQALDQALVHGPHPRSGVSARARG